MTVSASADAGRLRDLHCWPPRGRGGGGAHHKNRKNWSAQWTKDCTFVRVFVGGNSLTLSHAAYGLLTVLLAALQRLFSLAFVALDREARGQTFWRQGGPFVKLSSTVGGKRRWLEGKLRCGG